MRKHLSIILLIITLIAYLSVLVSPRYLWFFGFISLLIPVLLAVHFVLMLVYVRKLKKKFFYHLVVLVAGIYFIKGTYSISFSDFDTPGLNVLSYNVRVFNNYVELKDEDYTSSRKMISWAIQNPADIKCFQEYFNKTNSNVFNIEQRMKAAGWENSYVKVIFEDREHGEFGLAIFSVFPIINRGDIESESGEFLNSIYADMLIGGDTIRIYNTHLESMSIDEENLVNTDRLRKSYRDTGYRLKNGFISRSGQVEGLVEHIKECPYKIILCGDLNELPYSYPYFALRSLLDNAFEKAGNGFGFSYNGKLFFLRIDNQFYSRNIEIFNFLTHRNIRYSDHFPITATYNVNKLNND